MSMLAAAGAAASKGHDVQYVTHGIALYCIGRRQCPLPVAAGVAASEGGEARAAVKPARRMPSHIFSHGPAALTARGAPVQIWQPWEVSALCFRISFRVSG